MYVVMLFDNKVATSRNIEKLKIDFDHVKSKVKNKLIELIKKNAFITVRELSKLTGLTISGIEKNIITLKSDGLLCRIGSANGGYWKIIKKSDENFKR